MVEKTKNQKYIIPSFIFSAVVFIVFLVLILFVLYPKLTLIGQEKEEVKSKIENYEALKKKGISYSEFNTLKAGHNSNAYLKGLFSKIDNDFFTKNFVNSNQGEEYNTFFNKKISKIKELESNQSYIEAQESYKSILPTYVENNYENEEGVMTDLKFVTYIESILYTFNIELANKSISVGNLNILSDYITDKEAPLDTTIFYIPYTFDITGRKSDVIDFIYFLENVGSVDLNDEGNIIVKEDSFIKKSLIGFKEGNILKNQIIDIEKIKMNNYIDSGVETNETGNFIEFIKKTQGNEKITVTIDAKFYVKGVPNYKIQESIDKITTRYDTLKEKYEEFKKNKDLPTEERIQVEKGIAYLNELNVSINEIKKDKSDLNKAYKKVIEINKLLDILQEKVKK